MESVQFEIKGKCKSNIRCRSFIYLKIKDIQNTKDEFIEMTKSTPYKDDGSSFNKEIDEWTDILVELYIRNLCKNKITIKLEHEKLQISKLVEHFTVKVKQLKLDSSIPKITVTNGNKCEDYTTLESAESMLSDYTNQLNFIQECINEINSYTVGS